MTSYLPAVEKPRGILMRVVYYVSRRQFGKVATPIAVMSARMPLAFGTFFGRVSKLDKKLTLPQETVLLVREQVASLNACPFCMDIGRWYAGKQSPGSLGKLDALAEYATSPLFSEAERAALDYASELTTHKVISSDTFAALARHYGDREICDLVWLVASEHLYNISNIGLNIGSDGFCELRPTAPTTDAALQ
jgi:alkylhydroperoxidase family enzyme